MDRRFRELAGRLIRRARLAATLRRWQRWAFILLALGIVFALCDRISFELGLREAYGLTSSGVLWGAAAVVLLAGIAAVIRSRRLPPGAILARLDRRAGSEEILSTAREAPEPFRDLLQERAVRLFEGREKELIPLPVTRYLLWLVPVLCTGSVLIAFPAETLYPPAAGFAPVPVRGPAPLDVRFENLSSGHIRSFEWDFGDGGTSEDENPVHRFVKPGRYRVSLRAVGPRGRDSVQREIEVLPPEAVVAGFEIRPTKGYAPLAVRTKNLSMNAGSFEWDFGDGSTSREVEPEHTFVRPGTYRVKLRASRGSREATAEREVHVLPKDAPLAEFAAHPREGEAPLTVSFEDRSLGDIRTYAWDLGDVYAGRARYRSERHVTHTYAVPGVYTVRLKVSGPKGGDLEVKEHYIRVGRHGRGGAGGGGTGRKPGRLYGKKKKRPKVGFKPEAVVPLTGEGPWVEKHKRVYTKGEADSGSEYREIFPRYRHQAEASVRRERIPVSAREFVKRYFERIRPR